MSINSKLKKVGIEIVEKLNTLQVNTIAINVANKLCSKFPEHNFDRRVIFELFSRLSMYSAKMPNDSSGAKYIFKNNAIYFNCELNLEEMSNVAIHECIHCIQYSNSDSKLNIGLWNTSSNFGLGLNEAAVQLMACEANSFKPVYENYYGISINTISPNYYPLECTLANEIAYFIGTYPLYDNILTGNDIFINTLSIKTSKKTCLNIVNSFDKLLALENELNFFISELQYASKAKDIKWLNNTINKHRQEIVNIFFKTQNLIIEKCFKSEFNNIRNLEDITTFNKKFYNFKNIMGYSDNYTFYNDFYRKMMSLVQEKREYIEKYGEINLYEGLSNSLAIVDNSKGLLSLIKNFTYKLKKLVKLNKNTEEEFKL